jgi:hypothetical protein
LTTLNTSKKEEANRKYGAWKLNPLLEFAYAKLKGLRYYLEVVLVHQKGSGAKVFKGNSFWLQPLFSLLPKLQVEYILDCSKWRCFRLS